MSAKFLPAWKDVAAELTAVRSLGFEMKGRLDFRNHDKPLGDSRATTPQLLDVQPVPASALIQFPKPFAPEGLGGPWIMPPFLMRDGLPNCSEALLLGRCVQLAPGH